MILSSVLQEEVQNEYYEQRAAPQIMLEAIFCTVSSFLSCVEDAEANIALQYSSRDLTRAV